MITLLDLIAQSIAHAGGVPLPAGRSFLAEAPREARPPRTTRARLARPLLVLGAALTRAGSRVAGACLPPAPARLS